MPMVMALRDRPKKVCARASPPSPAPAAAEQASHEAKNEPAEQGVATADPQPAAHQKVDRANQEDDVPVRPRCSGDGHGEQQRGDVVTLQRPAEWRHGALSRWQQ